MARLLVSMAGILLGKITEAAGRSELWPIRSELRNLETIVSSLKGVLRDAEEKQGNRSNLTPLLKQLQDAFSKTDDLIEELDCEYLMWKMKNRRNDVGVKLLQFSSCFSSNFVVSASGTAHKINEIIERLVGIDKQLSEFFLVEQENEHIKRLKSEMSLRTAITGSQVFGRILRSKKEAILSDNMDSIIGRDKAKESIINKLLTNGDDKQKFPAILSIHGSGGMGKTALAKLVYNAHQVFDHFDKRMWVCVSEDFDVRRIRRELLSSATGEQVPDAALTADRLQIRLQRNLIGRKFLLVLDDFGALNPKRESELEEILKMGADGSKIIITTRSEQTLNDVTTHEIERLDEEESMVFLKHALKDKELIGHLHEVAEKLVPKCGGAPLAIKCLAGLLSSEASDGAERANAKDLIELWRRLEMKGSCVLPAFRLSYDLMPSYLKPCFLCLSLLPKDYVFYSFELIQLWMAQGILHSSSENSDVVGQRYFNELWSRGLLEDVEEHAFGYWFKIHSLVHDLAVQLAEKEQENLGSLHHLSFVDSSNKDLPLSTIGKIRCLSVPMGGVEPKINRLPLVKCISKFRQLRFLNLCNFSLEEIPASIDMLKHLRYLDLRGNRRIKRLPESICKLQSLETLILAFCSELEELPRNIKNLINLRMLWITTKQASLGNDGIGNVTSLRFLAIGGSENLTHLFEDIDKLDSLQTLIIYDCKSLLTLPEGLKSLSGLCNMAIWGCEQLKFTFSLGSLGLKKLILRGFPSLAQLPNWIAELDESLEVLEVGEFPKLSILPSWLSNLWILRMLGISNCPKLTDKLPQYMMENYDELEELRITFCGLLSKTIMEPSKHRGLHISSIPNIYVDSRKIISDKAVHADHDKVTNHDDLVEGDKHDETIDGGHGSIREVQKDGVADDILHVDDEKVGGTKQNKAATDHSHIGDGQTVRGKQDEVAIGHSQVGDRQNVGAKQNEAATDHSNVGDGQTAGAKQDEATIDHGHVGDAQTIGAKQDEAATDDCHVGDGQNVGAKKQGEAADHVSNVGDGQTVVAKQDEAAIDDSNVGTGATNSDHSSNYLGDDGHPGGTQTTVITLQGF
ncbi:putative disease resistance protein RGA1 [Momordica charantia]|uniref:Disease resistance protein RGA1 n=1 Tax=Momordica charantia TaxID=3673 RepID=A0A6J1DSZ3_MOMCH|nr:putative disease resistance protein RGA1 [Momordica charantia]